MQSIEILRIFALKNVKSKTTDWPQNATLVLTWSTSFYLTSAGDPFMKEYGGWSGRSCFDSERYLALVLALFLFVCWHHSFPIAPLILVQKSQVNTLRVTLSKVDRGPKKVFHFTLQPSAEGRPNLTIGWKPPQGNGLSKKWKWSYCVGSSTVGLLSNCLLTLELSPAFKPNLGANGNLKTRSLAWN